MRSAALRQPFVFVTVLVSALLLATALLAQSAEFQKGVAEGAGRDRAVLAFYRSNGFQPVWIGRDRDSRARRGALLDAIRQAELHGLAPGAYDTTYLTTNLRRIRSDRDIGRVEAGLSRLFLAYAHDVQSGQIDPRRITRRVDEDGKPVIEIARKRPVRDGTELLQLVAGGNPGRLIAALPPQTAEYRALIQAKIAMEKLIARGGWGNPVPAGTYRLGDTGPGVLALRNRLQAMGYLRRGNGRSFDAGLQAGLMQAQRDLGLRADGVAGPDTVAMLNVPAPVRLASIVVAMERERWMNIDRGARHVVVNIPGFSAAIIDNGRVTFQTRAVVGENKNDQRTPEFSDRMDYMVINPSWFVPRSITVDEYLPMLQEDPTAVSHLDMIDDSGEIVSRKGIDFNSFTEDDFPFNLKEQPNQGNALGLVKFMFPNRFNIYLHDTPYKSLFRFDRRAFSHGCIRLAEPFDFAYEILSRQSRDPQGLFHQLLATGEETFLDLNRPIPVHLIYRTAFIGADGRMNFRDDLYRRDRMILDALRRDGVVIAGLRS